MLSRTVSKLSQIIVEILKQKRPLCVLRPPLGGVEATYAVHLRLIGKPIVDFVFVLIELFSLNVTAQTLRSIERISIGNRRL